MSTLKKKQKMNPILSYSSEPKEVNQSQPVLRTKTVNEDREKINQATGIFFLK